MGCGGVASRRHEKRTKQGEGQHRHCATGVYGRRGNESEYKKDKPEANKRVPYVGGCDEKDRCGGFPGGAVVENLPANAGNTGSSPGLGRSHMPRSN